METKTPRPDLTRRKHSPLKNILNSMDESAQVALLSRVSVQNLQDLEP